MMASSSKSNMRGNLRGASSSSAATAVSQEDDFMSIPSQGEEYADIQPEVSQLVQNIELYELEKLAQQHTYNILQQNQEVILKRVYIQLRQSIQLKKVQTVKIYLHKLIQYSFLNKRTPQAIDNILELITQWFNY